MILSEAYQAIRVATDSGGRGLRRFSEAEVAQLNLALQSADSTARHQALVLAAHSAYPLRELESTLTSLMQRPLIPEDMVWLLSAVRKNVMQARFKEGERLTHEFLESLGKLLHHQDKAVIEWALRTVEECGAQGIVFRPELAKIKPSLWSLWRAQNRTILELITFLERRWAAREKSG